VSFRSPPGTTPGGRAEAVDFSRGQVLARADVGMFVTLGKCELWHEISSSKNFPVFDGWTLCTEGAQRE
jgi:hypothetical protein